MNLLIQTVSKLQSRFGLSCRMVTKYMLVVVALKIRRSQGSEMHSLLTMKDLYETVKECDKFAAFKR